MDRKKAEKFDGVTWEDHSTDFRRKSGQIGLMAGAALFAANPLFGVGHGNSGTLTTGFLLRDGIVCRTLVNSHLTLLAEHGMLLSIPYFVVFLYALVYGRKKRTAWIAFAGLAFATGSASVFDWDLLFDFHDFGELPVMNLLELQKSR